MKLFNFRSVENERNFEKKLILSQKDSYLKTDVLEKVQNDVGYRDKIDLIEKALNHEQGWVLDIGSNTCGEAEVLSTRGFSIICSDVNEYALDISKLRTSKYGRPLLSYVACDGHRLPFKDASVNCISFIESLHHMHEPLTSLLQAARVLKPGGKLFLYEPYAYNPYRRISEIRDYFKGTIEKSFSIRAIKSMLKSAGFDRFVIKRHVLIPSTRKLENLSFLHRFFKKLYYKISKQSPKLFGSIVVEAIKPGVLTNDKQPLESILRCPITGAHLEKTPTGYVNTHPVKRYTYSELNGIPILIPFDDKT